MFDSCTFENIRSEGNALLKISAENCQLNIEKSSFSHLSLLDSSSNSEDYSKIAMINIDKL